MAIPAVRDELVLFLLVLAGACLYFCFSIEKEEKDGTFTDTSNFGENGAHYLNSQRTDSGDFGFDLRQSKLEYGITPPELQFRCSGLLSQPY